MPLALDHLQIFNLLPTPCVILGADSPRFSIIELNDSYLQVAQATKDQLIGKGFFEAFARHPHEDFLAEASALDAAITDKKAVASPTRRYDYRNDQGEIFQVLYLKSVNTPIMNNAGEVEYIIRSVTDVTDTVTSRRQEELAQTNLQEVTQLMAQAQELANFGNWQWNIVQNQVTWSKTLFNIYGLDHNTFKATFEGYQELLHPEDRERVYNLIFNAVQTKTDTTFDERIVRPNGEIRYLRSWGRVQTDATGNPVKMIGACLDITETKLTEIKLNRMREELEDHVKTLAISEKNYSDLFHLSPLPMWVLELKTLKFLDVNIAAIEHYGYSKEEFLTMTARSLWHNDRVQEFEKIVNSDEKSYAIFSKHIKKGGDEIIVRVRGTLMTFRGKNARLIVANDVTERQRHIDAIEKQNKQLQEIAWIQSHVVRAPLVRIMGLTELFKNYKSSEIDKQQLLDNILHSALELDEIIKTTSSKTEEVLLNNSINPTPYQG